MTNERLREFAEQAISYLIDNNLLEDFLEDRYLELTQEDKAYFEIENTEIPAVYFEGHEYIEYLEPEVYYDYAQPWHYVRTVKGGDGRMWDLVRNMETMEMRYTHV